MMSVKCAHCDNDGRRWPRRRCRSNEAAVAPRRRHRSARAWPRHFVRSHGCFERKGEMLRERAAAHKREREREFDSACFLNFFAFQLLAFQLHFSFFGPWPCFFFLERTSKNPGDPCSLPARPTLRTARLLRPFYPLSRHLGTRFMVSWMALRAAPPSARGGRWQSRSKRSNQDRSSWLLVLPRARAPRSAAEVADPKDVLLNDAEFLVNAHEKVRRRRKAGERAMGSC